MAKGAIIKEFLASVGFQADEASLKGALSKVAAFGIGIKIATAGIYAGLMRVATAEANLAREAESLNTTSDRLRELQYIAEQNGSSLDAVTSSMEALLAKNPRIKDSAKALHAVGERLKGMNTEQRRMYASKMGIDPSLIPALTSNVNELKNEFQAMYQVAGVGGKEAAESSKLFLAEINKLKTLGQMLARAISVSFLNRVSRDIEHLRKVVMENFDKIKRIMDIVITVVLRLSGVISAFIYRAVKLISSLVGWFDRLNGSQKNVIIGLGLFLAAWKLLNSGFLATPLGTIILGLTAIVALIDDYLTYMEGGRSYFNWGPWVDTIESARKSLSKIVDITLTFIAEHQTLITTVGKGLALFLGFKKVIAIVGAIRAAFSLLNLTMMANPVLFVLGLVIMATMLIIEYWDEVKDFILRVWDNIKDKVMAIVGFYVSIWQGVFDWFFGLWGSVSDALPDFGAWALKAVNGIKGFFGAGIQWVKDKIKSLVSFLPDWVLEKMGLKEGGLDNSASDAHSDADFEAAINNAMALNNAPISPSPMQAATISQNSKQDISMKSEATFNITTSDPIAAGNQAAKRQEQLNADLVRHTSGAMR